MNLLQKIEQGFVFFDGGMGTLLQDMGLQAGELPETWNVLHPDRITQLHLDYLNAGSDILTTNTFGANRLKYHGDCSVDTVIRAAIANAKEAISRCGKPDKYVALDIGPTGKLLAPYGDLAFDTAVEVFAEVVRTGAEYGADLILIETMSDLYELKAAVLAAKENASLPVFATVAFDAQGKLLTGADPAAVVATLEGLNVDAIGMNCGLGPMQMLDIFGDFSKHCSLPMIVNPNAGLPHTQNGKTVFDISPDAYAVAMAALAKMGARILGGCCGTTPSYIRALTQHLKNTSPLPIAKKQATVISSYTHAVTFSDLPILIGERINPTGKSRFKQALREMDFNYILEMGLTQKDCGAHALDVNVGLPEIDEPQMMCDTVQKLQAILDLPLQIDTSDPITMECALRIYNGKPLINSVNGKQESMEAVFPLVKKYGGVVIGLTLDEAGIPETAQGRLSIAKKIIATAQTYGIDKKDILIDPLVLTVSADSSAAMVTLEAVKLISEELGVKTTLGVSNVSFGLPQREYLNASFFTLALNNGLGAAIINPCSQEMMKAYRCFLALNAKDTSFAQYIRFAQNAPVATAAEQVSPNSLKDLIIKGLKEPAADKTAQLLCHAPAQEIIDGELLPALNIVGAGFEDKTLFLPQLLMSAEAAKASFAVIREAMLKSGNKGKPKGRILLATVKGDIHDIGKNIVRTLLENYNYEILDLGRDVDPEAIVQTAVAEDISLIGLSALMTTTVPAMQQTIELLKQQKPGCNVIVGGAVLTQTYANMIGADGYGSDAMATVRYAEAFFAKQHK